MGVNISTRIIREVLLTEAEGFDDNATEGSQAPVRDRAEESVHASKPEARVNETLADLLPLPALNSGLVVSGVV